MAKLTEEMEAFNHINNLFGGALRTAEQIEKVDIIKTSSSSLDYAIGVGGWPRGRVIQLAGQPSAGKTLLALLAIAEWQKQDPENCALFLDAEYTYDPKWAAKLGVDNTRVLLVKENSGVALFTGLIGKTSVNSVTKKVTKIPGLLDYIIDGKIIQSTAADGTIATFNCKKLGIIVLDSVASVNAPIEEHSDVGKQNMAVLARFFTVELKKLTPLVANANVAFIAINQIRNEPGAMFGDPTTTPGGYAWKHACSLMVMLAQSFSSANKIENSDSELIGGLIKGKIGKNKVARPFKVAQYKVLFDSGITDKANELLDVGVECGYIIRHNAVTVEIDGERLTSREKAINYIAEHYDEIEQCIREKYMSGNDNSSNTFSEEEVEPNPFELTNE